MGKKGGSIVVTTKGKELNVDRQDGGHTESRASMVETFYQSKDIIKFKGD